MKKLPRASGRVLEFIHAFTTEYGYSPSNREICTAMRWSSTNAAHQLLRRLEERGLITRAARRSRTLRVTELGKTELSYIAAEAAERKGIA